MTDPATDRRPAAPRPLILFGAFDRHNFGDLLLAHCVAALHPAREPVFAGLAARDLSPYGGHRVQTLAAVIAAHGGDAADFVHVGGEVLTTTAWEAAVMLQTTDAAARAIRAHDRNPAARRAWAESLLGTSRRMPFAVCGDDLPSGWTVHFNAAGGVALDGLDVEERAEVLQALRSAATVSVRDARTHAALADAGIRAALVRDPAAATARLLGGAIARRARDGEIAELAARMPHWIAVQLAADWGDDATLDRIAAALSRRRSHLDAGIVLFRAGLAPWHDDRETLERLAARMVGQPVAVFESAHVLDLCALLAGARAYLGTSLHGWIVADSFEVPAHCLVRGAADKAAAYVDTWTAAGRRWRTLADDDLLPSPRDPG
jgi:hypothetical protein